MRKRMAWFAWPMTVVLALAMSTTASAQSAAETYTATASVRTAGGAATTAPVTIVIARWTSDGEREKAVAALKAGGNAALKQVLEAMPAAGTIQIRDRTTTLHYARALKAGSGRVMTVIAAEPIAYLGAGGPEAKPKTGDEVSLALFEVNTAGTGEGDELAPAATLKVDANGAFVIEDYGAEAVRLAGIAKK